MKKIISLLLAVALIVTMVPCSVFAGTSSANPEYVSSTKEAGVLLRDGMVNREEKITIYYEISKDETFNQKLVTTLSKSIYNEAVKHTGNPQEGDALDYCTGGYKVSAMAVDGGDVYKTTLVYYMTYYTTAKQEQKLSQEIDKLKKKLAIDGKTDVEKITAIHDYMRDHIAYDYDGKDDAGNTICHTAYAALIKGKAVCQGYATLFYRLALEYGIDARIISGVSLGENHGWNIVKIGNAYYNIDTTWDSTTKSNRYFLKSDGDFVDHKRDAAHSTAAFTKAYPMSKTSYAIKCSKHEGTTKTTKATMTKNGSVVKTCKHCGKVMSKKTLYKIGSIKLSYQSTAYTGSTKSPKIIVKDSAGKTISATNYLVEIPKGRKKVGTYTYTVTFSGKQYSGSKKLTLTINPKTPTISSASAAKKGFTAKWKAVSAQADGYQIQYATNKNFSSGKKTVKVKGIKSKSKKISSLKTKKTYYVRVRTYKTVSGKTYYSAWSKSKSVKTK